MAMYFLALDYGPDLINDVANQYINAINSGFGLIKGDVTWLLNVLIILSIMWSAALWALSDDHIIVQFARKIVYIGLFAWIIQNWQTLTDTLARSFMDLGLKAGGFDSANYYTAQPGNIAYLGYTTAQPLMDQIARLTGPVAFFKNFVEIAFLFLAICAIVAAFCVITIQVVVALLTFKFGSLAAFVLVPFAVLSKTAFIAERPLGWVVGSGVRLMVLTLVLGVGNHIFQELKVPPGQTVTTYQAFCIALAALLLMVLSLVASRLASDLIIGGPSLGVGTAINTSAMALNTTAATAEKARSAVKLLDRRTVLVCGGVTVPAPPFTERDLGLLVSDIELVQSHFNQSRAIIVADFEDKFSLIQEHFRRVFPAAEDRGMLPIVLVHSHSNFVQVSALRDKDHKQSSAEIFLISDAPKAAERIARHVPGPPVGNATIEPRGLLSDLADELLLRRAFSDCERIYLERLGGGKASIGVYRTHAWLKESQVGPRPLPFFVKIANPAEVAKEQQCYIDYAEHYIPFNLRPNLDRRRCVHARNRAALVGGFVDDAVPLRKSLRSGHGIGALFSLFETSFRGFRLQPFHKQDAPRSNVLKGFADYRIWTEGLAADIREQAISFGLTVSPEEMRAKVCQAAEPLKCWVAPYHGDLHAGNIMIRGGDAILIDFSSAANGPLTADPAALEVSLMFGTDSDDDPASFQQWRSFIDEMYVQPISSLHPPVFYDSTPGRFSWLGRSLRELRHVFLGCGCDCIEINLVLATYLMRFARLPLEDLPSKELEDLAHERHAYALVVAGRLTSDLPGGKS